MAVTLRIHENPPATPTPAPDGLTAKAAALDPEPIWARIEAWCSYRWAARAATFTIEGFVGDEWLSAIAPFDLSNGGALIWRGGWVNTSVTETALGFELPETGRFQLVGVVGTDETPDATVQEAFRRFAEYLADGSSRGFAGSSSMKVEAGNVGYEMDRSPAYLAKAMQWSGAGDLLRGYRHKAVA